MNDTASEARRRAADKAEEGPSDHGRAVDDRPDRGEAEHDRPESGKTRESPAPDREEDAERGYGLALERLREIESWLDEKQLDRVEAVVEDLHSADLADLLEQLDPDDRRTVVDILRPNFDGEVFSYLDDTIRDEVVEQLGPRELARAVAELESDDAINLIQDLDEKAQAEILDNLPAEARQLVEEGLTFPEYSAGRMMQRHLVSVPQFWTVGKTLDFLRAAADDLPEDFYDIFIVDPMHRVVGTAPLSRIMRRRRSIKIAELVSEDIHVIPATLDREEVAHLFRQYGLVSAPVVDPAGRLIGVITVDDVVDVIDEEAEDDLLKLGGVGEESIYGAVLDITKARFSWLAVNLLTAVIASGVIALFEATIEQVVALAILMPIVASMGGNAGTQSLTIAVRGLATREISPLNATRVVTKELLVGLINGALFAVISGGIAAAWFGDWMLGAVIGVAMIVNLFVAALAGTLIPMGLGKIGIDPAVASSVFLTTVTDVVGFFAFLGLAAWLLL